MATRSYRPSENFHISDGAERLEGNIQQVALGQLIPRIAERNRIATDTVPVYVYYFSELRAARRCSCFNIEASPDYLCTACFGTGLVGGYVKYGTELSVIDITHPNIRSANVFPNYKKRTKPVSFGLIDGAKYGSIEVDIPIKTNVGVIDSLSASSHVPEGSELNAYIKAPTDSYYVDLTKDNLTERLFHSSLTVKVDFSRISPENGSPYLDVIQIRYKTIQNNLIKVNIPRTEKSIMLQELGVADDWQQINFWTDASVIKQSTTDDFLMTASGRTRWKLVLVKPFDPAGHNVSWDLTARLVHNYEGMNNVPAGITEKP